MSRRIRMDDSYTALRSRPPRPPAGRRRPPPRRRPRRHPRRRVLALLAVVGVAAAVAVTVASAGGGGGAAHPSAHTPTFFVRLQQLAGTGAGSFSSSEHLSENAAINRTLKYTPWVRVAGRQHREMALTFDDGPGPYSPAVLAILKREKVPATFFEIGMMEQWFYASTRQIVARGDVIGDHTETHPPMSELSPALQQQQLIQQTGAIGRYGAPFPRLFRPPYGLFNATTLKLLHHYHMLMVLWTVDTDDYTRPGVKAIVHSVIAGARPGAIILMHDGGGNRQETVDALPQIIKDLRARGYKLVTVPQLLIDNPAPHNQDISSVLGSGG